MAEGPLVEVGRVGRAHGVLGAVYVTLTTDRRERVGRGARLQAAGRWLTVAEARQQPNGKWLTRFDELTDRNEAERLTGAELLAEPLDDPDAVWVADLIGARVVEVSGVQRGRCVAVIDNPAHDLLELDGGALVPAVFVVELRGRGADGVVVIDPPDGLFTLNE